MRNREWSEEEKGVSQLYENEYLLEVYECSLGSEFRFLHLFETLCSFLYFRSSQFQPFFMTISFPIHEEVPFAIFMST